jgi:NADH-quinone oxidoreductase subunit K
MSLIFYLLVSGTVFLIGTFGLVLNKKNILLILMSVELMLFAANFNFILFSVFIDDLVGQIFVLFTVAIAAAESAIGLAILVAHFRVCNSISTEKLKTLRG